MTNVHDFTIENTKTVSIDSFNNYSIAQMQKDTANHNGWVKLVPHNHQKEEDSQNFLDIFSNHYFIQFAVSSLCSNIRYGNIFVNNQKLFQIQKHQPPFSSNFIQRYYWLFQNFFLDVWKDNMGENLTNFFELKIQETLSDVEIISFHYQLKEVAMINIGTGNNSDDDLYYKINWIWIDPSIGQELRLNLHSSICESLRKMSTNDATRFYAGIYGKNIRSQKFFKKIGFKTVWASLYLPAT